MEIRLKHKVGDFVTLIRNEQIWRVIAIHISAYTKNHMDIIYDLQDERGRRIITQEQKIKEI